MAIIRKYCKGDIESIEPNEFGRKDWAENSDKSQLETGEAYTVEVEGYKCVVCIEPQDNGTYYFGLRPTGESARYMSNIYGLFLIGSSAAAPLGRFLTAASGRKSCINSWEQQNTANLKGEYYG